MRVKRLLSFVFFVCCMLSIIILDMQPVRSASPVVSNRKTTPVSNVQTASFITKKSFPSLLAIQK